MVKRYEPKDLFAVVMDAKTGEILHIVNVQRSTPKRVKTLEKMGE